MFTAKEYMRAESLEQAWSLNQKKSSAVLGGMMWLKMGNGRKGTIIDLSGNSPSGPCAPCASWRPIRG